MTREEKRKDRRERGRVMVTGDRGRGKRRDGEEGEGGGRERKGEKGKGRIEEISPPRSFLKVGAYGLK